MYIDGNVALIHARLCVVDPENGLQPMGLRLGGEEYTLVYNGELYNTGELRRELKSLGHIFHTHSDTEVLLHAYGEWGEECVERLNGIYAFAVWEKRGGRLFLARDRMGVKPLFTPGGTKACCSPQSARRSFATRLSRCLRSSGPRRWRSCWPTAARRRGTGS